MPGITNPAEVYFKDGLWGWAATVWEKLVSSGGRLFTALHGWDGSAWQKLPMVWGYSDRWHEPLTHPKDGDGNYVMDFTAVDLGYVYVLQAIQYVNDTSAVLISSYVQSALGGQPLITPSTPGAGVYVIIAGLNYTLKYLDHVRIIFWGCSDNDVLNASVWGYKMKIA